MKQDVVKKCWECKVRDCNKYRFGGVCKACAKNLAEERDQRKDREIKSVYLSESRNRYKTYFT